MKSTCARFTAPTFLSLALMLGSSAAYAQTAPPAPTPPPAPIGAPPPAAAAVVTVPKFVANEPSFNREDGTTVTFAAGGMWNTGNSRQLALTTNGAFETRFADNGIGFSLLGNYAQGAPPNEPIQVTAQNLQGRVRYDRYILPNASFFLIETGRHDLLQGIDLRNNLDPGFKYLFFKAMSNTLWAEVGYDLQHDIRRNGARTVVDELGNPVLDDNGQLTILPKTETDHSARVYLGYKHAFNEEVTLSTGLEYLQSFVHSTRNRINYDALFAAKVGGGLAVGLGFSLRYDHDPLPDKKQLDTATTVSLIYSFSSDAPKAVEAPACPVYECEAVPPNAPFVNEPSTPATPAPELPAPEPADQPPVAPTPQ